MTARLELALQAYLTSSLLLLDELGYLPIDKGSADLLFQVVADCYESGWIVITTNRPFRDWAGSSTLTTRWLPADSGQQLSYES